MSDEAARWLFAGMLAIAAAILLAGGLYTVTAPSGERGPSVVIANKFTGEAQLCAGVECMRVYPVSVGRKDKFDP